MRAILRDVVVCVLVGGIGSGGAAHAQTTPTQTTASQNTAAQPDSANPDKSGTDSKKTTAAKDAPTTVVVTGKKPGNHIDRQVYDVTKNPDALTGTAAEALNKVPGVTVDPSGNVTLRGHNVRIFLNGRPSLMLSGDNRGVALRAMPSSYLSSVEVISNPGSQYGSGSSDPIINIVTKRKLPPGLFGSASARLNSTGRGQANIYSTLAAGELNLTGFSVYYGDRQPSTSGFNLQGFDATSGLGTNTTQSNSLSLVHSNGVFDSLSAEYNLSPDDVLNVGSTYPYPRSESTSAGWNGRSARQANLCARRKLHGLSGSERGQRCSSRIPVVHSRFFGPCLCDQWKAFCRSCARPIWVITAILIRRRPGLSQIATPAPDLTWRATAQIKAARNRRFDGL